MHFKKITLLVATGALAITMSTGVAYGASDKNSSSGSNVTPVTEQVGASDKVAKHRGDCNAELAKVLGMDATVLGQKLKSGETLAKIAAEQKIEVSVITSNLEAKFNARIDKAVSEGKLTNEKAVTIKSKTSEKVAKMINEPMTEHKGRAGKGNGFMNVKNQIPALVGLQNATQLEEQINSGKTLADIASSNNITKEKLIGEVQSLMKANLAQAVKDNKITAEKAAAIESKMPQMVERMVTRVHKDK